MKALRVLIAGIALSGILTCGASAQDDGGAMIALAMCGFPMWSSGVTVHRLSDSSSRDIVGTCWGLQFGRLVKLNDKGWDSVELGVLYGSGARDGDGATVRNWVVPVIYNHRMSLGICECDGDAYGMIGGGLVFSRIQVEREDADSESVTSARLGLQGGLGYGHCIGTVSVMLELKYLWANSAGTDGLSLSLSALF